ncbi:Lipocalin-like domain-containing protein [Hypoxylon crocopeplum]|nr:Lipocalin-like domain-containing protein [Hypoxylon crocopeplum]
MVKPEDVIKAISGSWLYLNKTSFYDNGTISDKEDPTLGRNPVGMLTYDSAGYMSANFMSSRTDDRPADIDTAKPEYGSDAEWALIGKHILAYAGPWYVSVTTDDVETGQITHGPTDIAWLPTWVGIELWKNYTLFEDGKTMRFISKTQNGLLSDMYFKRLG